MKKFLNVGDIGNLDSALKEAFEIKKNRFAYQDLGKNKTLLMVFFNSSLRTRLSTQKAAMNLGMNVIVLDVNLMDFDGFEPYEFISMDGHSKKEENTFDNIVVKPHTNPVPTKDGQILTAELKPFSWNVIKLRMNEK